jgi:UDP-glucuronate decarboxylase
MYSDEITQNILLNDALYVNESVDLSQLDGLDVTITGATGLVGFNLLCALNYYNRSLAKKPIRIHALSHRRPDGIIESIFNASRINSLVGDLSDNNFIASLPKSDAIIHSAGYGQPGLFLEDKLKTISINTTATIGLSKNLRKGGRFLFLSSSEVYSGCGSDENKETDIGTTNPTHPRSCYIESKRTGEAIINALREKGYRASSARLALAYGPGVKPGDQRVLNQFIEKGICGQIDLLDSGQALRTYGYIADVVSMLLHILIRGKEPVYNVGGRSVTSIKDLAKKIGREMNVAVLVPNSSSGMKGAPNFVGLNLSKIEDEFLITKYIDLHQGLINTIDWIKNYE